MSQWLQFGRDRNYRSMVNTPLQTESWDPCGKASSPHHPRAVWLQFLAPTSLRNDHVITAYSDSPPGHRNCVPIFLCAASPVILSGENIQTPLGATMGLPTHYLRSLPRLPTFKIVPLLFILLDSWSSLSFFSKLLFYSRVSISLIWLVQSASQSSSQHMPS